MIFSGAVLRDRFSHNFRMWYSKVLSKTVILRLVPNKCALYWKRNLGYQCALLTTSFALLFLGQLLRPLSHIIQLLPPIRS